MQFDNERAEIPDEEIENINRTSNPKYRRDASAGRIVCNDGVTGGSTFRELRKTSNTRMGDTRSISVCELREKANEAVNVRDDQRNQLFDVLLNYKEYFTKQPGKCKLMRYKYEVTSPEPIVGSTRPIPFSVRAEQLFRDGIIEYSESTFLNPLTLVFLEGNEREGSSKKSETEIRENKMCARCPTRSSL
jgi:hypothetical protein